MTTDIDVTERIEGPYGTVEFIPHPPLEEAGNDRTRAALELSRGTWLITAPGYHPVWSQYALSLISLADHPDTPPAELKFPGATHELLLLAINPDHKQTVETMREHCRKGNLPFLTPINIAEQFECTDDEIRQIAWLAARAVVFGRLNPETADAPDRIRETWLSACVKTLAHIRGEEHSAE